MLLRTLTRHVKDQNWFAVVLDLAIVVVGVFIGIQVANWNDLQQDKTGLASSLQRLDQEVAHNIRMIDDVVGHYGETREDLDRGLVALDTCTYSPEGQTALERSLFDFVEDVQPNFVTVALDQLARHDRYQDLLSPGFQSGFGLYAGRLKEENEQLTSHYERMWSHHVNHHPDVNAFFTPDAETYEGWRFELDRPFAEICADASFRNRFMNTVGFYTAIHHRLMQFRTEAEQFKNALNHERAAH